MLDSSVENTNEAAVKLNVDFQFPAPVYTVEIPKFFPAVRKLSDKLLADKKRAVGVDKNHPMLMTDNFFGEESVASFTQFVGQTAWNLLSEQGYAMDNMDVVFDEMWVQQHYKHSLMEQHTHRFGSQIVGFYFLDVPTPTPQAKFYDPRLAAMQGSLREKDPEKLTIASSVITYNPKPGLMIFTNSWLAHSFSKNLSTKPFSFVHFNLTAEPSPVQPIMPAPAAGAVEVI